MTDIIEFTFKNAFDHTTNVSKSLSRAVRIKNTAKEKIQRVYNKSLSQLVSVKESTKQEILLKDLIDLSNEQIQKLSDILHKLNSTPLKQEGKAVLFTKELVNKARNRWSWIDTSMVQTIPADWDNVDFTPEEVTSIEITKPVEVSKIPNEGISNISIPKFEVEGNAKEIPLISEPTNIEVAPTTEAESAQSKKIEEKINELLSRNVIEKTDNNIIKIDAEEYKRKPAESKIEVKETTEELLQKINELKNELSAMSVEKEAYRDRCMEMSTKSRELSKTKFELENYRKQVELLTRRVNETEQSFVSEKEKYELVKSNIISLFNEPQEKLKNAA